MIFSSVCASFNIEINNNKIKKIKIAYGGMSSIPKRAFNCEKILLNSFLSDKIIDKAKKLLEKDFKPITDARASKKIPYGSCKKFIGEMFFRS